jgi:putative oxidoreductase
MGNQALIEKGLRIFLGLFLIVYALNQFFHFFPTSYGAMPANAEDFIDAVVIYLPALYIFEILIGLFLILNKWSALILLMLFPLSVAFLIFMYANNDLSETWPSLVVAVSNMLLLYLERDKFRPLFA